MKLSVHNHDRDVAGLRYLYSVISRRSGGVSIGVNLNPNNRCNWHCIYCQVPDLDFGSAPAIDLPRFREELFSFLRDVTQGDWLEQHAPPEARTIMDIAFSGNGEPTSAKEFVECIELVAEARSAFDIPETVPTVLITNGSLLHQPRVQKGLSQLAEINGQVWFKIDSLIQSRRLEINHCKSSLEQVRRNLQDSCQRCPTWIQTMALALDGEAPSVEEQEAYIEFVSEAAKDFPGLQGILLYGLARPSLQQGSERLSRLPKEWMEDYATRLRARGLRVRLSP